MNAKIGLEDIRFHARHGFYEEEHLLGNEFSIDVEVESDILQAATQDDLGGTVNYSTIYYLVQAEMKKPAKLLEALAYRIAARIQHQFNGVQRVKIRLRKLHPPLGGQVGAAVVEIELGPGAGGAMAGTMPNPFGQKQVFDEPDEDEAGYYDDDEEGDYDPEFGDEYDYE